MVTLGLVKAIARGFKGDGIPVATAGEVTPRPVRKITRTSFLWIGSESVTSSPLLSRMMVGMSVFGPATPEWKTPGAPGRT